MDFYFLIIGVSLFLGGQTGKTGPGVPKTGDRKEKPGRTRIPLVITLLSPPQFSVFGWSVLEVLPLVARLYS
jgi:hypothetical protein